MQTPNLQGQDIVTIWHERDGNSGSYTDVINDVCLSYFPGFIGNSETAIVIINGKGEGRNRYLIYEGDRRDELSKIFPDVDALKAHWKEHGGHFWSDDLND